MNITQGKTVQARSRSFRFSSLNGSLGTAIATAALLLGTTLSGTALAASSLSLDCHGKKKDFMAEPASASELSVNVVDLTDTEANLEQAAEGDDESLAPLLYLAPRVASILDDVFEGEEDTAVTEPATMAPMAESSDDAAAVTTEADDTLTVQPALLRIHRQMYRTDI